MNTVVSRPVRAKTADKYTAEYIRMSTIKSATDAAAPAPKAAAAPKPTPAPTPAPQAMEEDWKVWQKAILEGKPYYDNGESPARSNYYTADSDRRVLKDKVTSNGSFCVCCGAFWLNENGGYNHARNVPFPKDNRGIIFGQFQTAEQLLKHLVWVEKYETFEIQDGEHTHTLAWRDA